MAAPGVANSMLSFVNDVRSGGPTKAKGAKRQGAGQALVLNLNSRS